MIPVTIKSHENRDIDTVHWEKKLSISLLFWKEPKLINCFKTTLHQETKDSLISDIVSDTHLTNRAARKEEAV